MPINSGSYRIKLPQIRDETESEEAKKKGMKGNYLTVKGNSMGKTRWEEKLAIELELFNQE